VTNWKPLNVASTRRPEPEPERIHTKCRNCSDRGFVGDRYPGDVAAILANCIPCDCPAGKWFRDEIALRGEHCDAPGCEGEAVEAVRGIKVCVMHRLAAVDVWRAAGARCGPEDWLAAVRKVAKVKESKNV
jgi:hypothetical protein